MGDIVEGTGEVDIDAAYQPPLLQALRYHLLVLQQVGPHLVLVPEPLLIPEEDT